MRLVSLRPYALLLAVLALAAAGFAFAQDDGEEEKSRFVRFVERQLSTPNRQISLGAIDGALSSDVRIGSITIADREGVWLSIEGIHLVWSRLALVRGRLDVDLLEAESITLVRAPLPDEEAEEVEEEDEAADEPFELPDLPVAIELDRLAVERVEIAEGVIGPAAALSLLGNVAFDDGALDAELAIERLDEPGELTLAASFDSASRDLAIDLTVSEPENGVIANALNIEGRPALSFEIAGEGPLSDFAADITLVAGGETLLAGDVAIDGANGGLNFAADLDGNLAPLVAAPYQPFVADGSRLTLDATRGDDGAVTVRQATIASGVADVSLSAALAPDFVPVELSLQADLSQDDGAPVPLPGFEGEASIGSAAVTARLGGDLGERFELRATLEALDTPVLAASTAELVAEGDGTAIASPEERAGSFTVSGTAQGLASDDPEVAEALGEELTLSASGAFDADDGVSIADARVATGTVAATFAGTIADAVAGDYALAVTDLAAFAGLAGRDLDGALDLTAQGRVGFDGLFDLTVDASATDLALGIAPVDGLLAGTTRFAGGAARTAEGLAFDALRLETPQAGFVIDGAVTDEVADLAADASLADVGALDERLDGSVEAALRISGNPSSPSLDVRVRSPSLTVADNTLTDLAVAFDGTLDRTAEAAFAIDGALDVDGRYDDAPLALDAQLETDDEARELDGLDVTIAGARVTGSLALDADGLIDGNVALSVPDLSRLAALALVEASGSLEAEVALSATDGEQSADIDAEARSVELPGLSLGFAAVDLAIDNLFGVPAVEGRADVNALRTAGITVGTASLVASRDGGVTNARLTADLGAASLIARGALERLPQGFAARLTEFELAREGFAATLGSPAEVRVTDGDVAIDDLRLSVGEGSLAVSGTVADTLDLTAELDALPLAVANLVKPDLEAAGTVSGAVELTGARDAPVATARLEANGVTAAPLAERGIEPLSLTAAGRYADGTATVERFATEVGGGSVTAFGTVGDRLDLIVEVEALPLALANAAAPELALSGSVTGRVDVSGSLDAPVAEFRVATDDASAAPLREADLGPLAVTVSGTYADGAAELEEAVATLGEGSITARGQVGTSLDVTATLDEVPLALVNAVRPELAVAGSLSGEVSAQGPIARPEVEFSLTVPSVLTAPQRDAGLPPASIDVAGSALGTDVTLDEAVARIGEGEVRASGTIGDDLDVTVAADAVPVSLANAVRPELGLSGTLTARATASGSLADPRAEFDASIDALSAEPLRNAGIDALEVSASGAFADGRIDLASLDVDGAGVTVDAAGTVPLSGAGLDVSVEARAPLSLADAFLAERGASVEGEVVVDASVSGSLQDPDVTGEVSAADVTFRDPQSNLVVENLDLSASLTGDAVVFDQLSANLGDGTIAVDGSIGLGEGFPADLTVTARNARYADGRLVAVTFDADLAITGPLTGAPLIAGDVAIDRAEITVPTRLGGSAALIEVAHRNLAADVAATLRRAEVGPYADDPEEAGADGAGGVRLDVTVSAPARVFIRGRGIDAEFGGEVTLTGPISNISPVGQFELIRGRLVILGQRIVFEEGEVTLFGDLNPAIRLVAMTRTREVTVRVIVEGQATDPEVRFTSEPELPQDEVLAQLLFGRSVSDLSAFQLAQLAAAVAELTGAGGGPSIIDQVRVFSGLDNLEIVSTPEGGTSAQAGRYIADNVYVGVRAGDRSSGVTVNLDITQGLTLRGEALTDESSIGLFYEREY